MSSSTKPGEDADPPDEDLLTAERVIRELLNAIKVTRSTGLLDDPPNDVYRDATRVTTEHELEEAGIDVRPLYDVSKPHHFFTWSSILCKEGFYAGKDGALIWLRFNHKTGKLVGMYRWTQEETVVTVPSHLVAILLNPGELEQGPSVGAIALEKFIEVFEELAWDALEKARQTHETMSSLSSPRAVEIKRKMSAR